MYVYLYIKERVRLLDLENHRMVCVNNVTHEAVWVRMGLITTVYTIFSRVYTLPELFIFYYVLYHCYHSFCKSCQLFFMVCHCRHRSVLILIRLIFESNYIKMHIVWCWEQKCKHTRAHAHNLRSENKFLTIFVWFRGWSNTFSIVNRYSN